MRILYIKEVSILNEDDLHGFCEYDDIFGCNASFLKAYYKDLLKLEKHILISIAGHIIECLAKKIDIK